MKNRIYSVVVVLLLLSTFLFLPPQTTSAQNEEISPQDLIELVNSLRAGNGLPALNVNSSIMGTAQTFADQMAAQELTWHIGGHREAIAATGYGAGKTVWATENFAMGYGGYNLVDIQAEWADDLHMKPMRESKYCDIGAGVATAASGMTYYIVQVAYTTPGSCEVSNETYDFSNEPETTSQETSPENESVAEPIEIGDDAFTHEVVSGDSLWGIAQTYETDIETVQTLNGLASNEIYIGQLLIVPTTVSIAMTQAALATPLPTTTPLPPTATPEPTATPLPEATNTKAPTQTDLPAEETAATQAPAESAETNSSSNKNQSPLFWQITAGVELAALLVIIGVFWQPWKNKKFF